MDYRLEYENWKKTVEDPELKQQLLNIEGDDKEIRSRFENSLSFGTAGLRGILGAGTNRMNIYTVGWATQGLADYINGRYGGGEVAIAYDSRHKSREFAEECAGILAENDITAYIYKELMPTPMLSFAVRELGCKAGIMITASHNPAIYNGYKVYGSDGCQMTIEDSDAVLEKLKYVDVLNGVKRGSFKNAVKNSSVKYIGKKVIDNYFKQVEKQQLNPGICLDYPLKIVYTPLNGTGNKPVRRILERIGAARVIVVPEQELPDGDFTTAPYPNPELPDALKLGLKLCEKEKPDIFIATDPDADRVGFAVRREGKYRVLTGNEIGILLLNYCIAARKEKRNMPKNPIAVKSVVSTSLADKIAAAGGVEMITVLTGFKYIGEQILFLEQRGEEKRFIFGFEESCGYLAGSYVRDKDAVFAAMMLAEMTSYYRSKGISIIDLLEGLYKQYGHYINSVVNIDFHGADGINEMKVIMNNLRTRNVGEIAGRGVLECLDYESGVKIDTVTGGKTGIGLPLSDIMQYNLAGGASVIIRPSGTEPKMKIYLSAGEESQKKSQKLINELSAAAKELIGASE